VAGAHHCGESLRKHKNWFMFGASPGIPGAREPGSSEGLRESGSTNVRFAPDVNARPEHWFKGRWNVGHDEARIAAGASRAAAWLGFGVVSEW